MVNSTLNQLFLQLIRYSLVGFLNTFFGFTIILIFMTLGYSPYISNALGYILGSLLSYWLNYRWTFSSGTGSRSYLKYLSAICISYILNISVLFLFVEFFHFPIVTAQLFGVVIYSLSIFIFCRYFVFADNHL
jgi:putative flippase GtrA